MKGRRVEAQPHELEPGDYTARKDTDTGELTWYCCTPNGLVGNLDAHDVTEHDDGTITVSPSILVDRVGAGPTWHGHLERGVWRSVG